MWNEKCNCGRPARYFMVDGQSSCNKYAVCPSYDELESELKKVKQNFMELLDAAESLQFFREGTDYYKDAEEVVLRFKEDNYVQAKV